MSSVESLLDLRLGNLKSAVLTRLRLWTKQCPCLHSRSCFFVFQICFVCGEVIRFIYFTFANGGPGPHACALPLSSPPHSTLALVLHPNPWP